MASRTYCILLFGDDSALARELTDWLIGAGHRADTADSASEAENLAASVSYDLALLDLASEGAGELQERLHSTRPDLTVVVLAEAAAMGLARGALKAGAYDYLIKPLDREGVLQAVQRATRYHSLRRENSRLRALLEAISTSEFVFGPSPSMKRLLELVEAVVKTEAPVLVTGEFGTGRESIARYIHVRSRRCYGPLVIVNCGALTESELETELFGSEDPSPHESTPSRDSKLQLADGGTLFLDEIAALSPRIQARLLNALENSEAAPGAEREPSRADFRVIAATTRNLGAAVDKGVFRKDLFWRLNVVTIEIPPLRQRPEDIPALAEHFLTVLAREMNRKPMHLSPEAVEALQQHSWQGNVRELRNALEKAVMVGTPPTIVPADLPLRMTIPATGPEALALTEVEKSHIRRVLEACRWNISRAAKLLEVDRSTLYNKIAKYGFKRSA